ncbi:MAG: exoZ, partial [Myxococcaceae bacterium]|nr:exoZ [Myxococcaceae bacterium]
MQLSSGPASAVRFSVEAPEGKARRKYLSLQYLRGLAAALVVLQHTDRSDMSSPFGDNEFAKCGVHVFFVISGFIMYTAAKNERVVEFVWKRIVRIAPLYWLVTALWLTSNQLRGAPITRSGLHVVLSLLFVPHYSPEFPTKLWPCLVPGWTLNLELFFYAVFGLGLAMRRPLLIPLVTILTLAVFGRVIRSDAPLWLAYTDPVVLEFAAGLLIAWLIDQDDARYSVYTALCLGGLFAASWLLGWAMPVQVGIFSATLLTASICLERSGYVPELRVLHVLGDASYSIYLWHVFAISGVTAVLHVVARPDFTANAGPWLVMLTALVGGYLIHVSVEQ